MLDLGELSKIKPLPIWTREGSLGHRTATLRGADHVLGAAQGDLFTALQHNGSVCR